MDSLKIAQPQPFYFKHGPRAVLLLHGFTGTSADVRMLGRFLEKKGYTSHAPHYRGHGVPPEELIQTNPEQWWEDVLSGYDFLKSEGFDEIAVAGLSLGGVFTLKLSMCRPVLGAVSMCAPMTMKTTDLMYEGVLKYAAQYKKYEGKSQEVIAQEVEALRHQTMDSLPDLQQLIQSTRQQLDDVFAPLFVVQARHDTVIDPQSAEWIMDNVSSAEKSIKWYEESGHIITLDKEKDQLHEDIYTFLDQLDWSHDIE